MPFDSIGSTCLPIICQSKRSVKKYTNSMIPSTQNPVKNEAVAPIETKRIK